jgi:hypothetical protein
MIQLKTKPNICLYEANLRFMLKIYEGNSRINEVPPLAEFASLASEITLILPPSFST